MAVVVAGQILANITGLPYSDPTDVDDDSTAAPYGDLNVFAPPAAGSAGFLTLSPEAAAVLAQLTNGPCTITISQGAGTLNTTVSQ
jgi:hypothetical protein